MEEQLPDLIDITVLERHLRVDLLDLGGETLLEGRHDSPASSLHQIFALLHHVRRHDVIYMESRHFEFHPLDAPATNKANLSILLRSRTGLLAKLQTYEPFDGGLYVRILLIQMDTGQVQAPECKARSIVAGEDPLYFFEGGIRTSQLGLQGLEVARSLLSVGNVARIGERIRLSNGVEETDSLISRGGNQELTLVQVADVSD